MTIFGTIYNDNDTTNGVPSIFRPAISGTVGNDTIDALAGDDLVFADDGSDLVYGRENNDTLYGGYGADTLYGGDGNDYMDGGGSLFLDTSNDRFDGGAGNDFIWGGKGADSLNGGLGIDTLRGSTGNDTYAIDNVGDVIEEFSLGGTDTVISSIDYTLGSELENSILLAGTATLNSTGNALANWMAGNAGANIISGGQGNDTLIGAAGNDSLHGNQQLDNLRGGPGADTLTGGAGEDRFTFNSPNEGFDRITDFTVVDDTIDVARGGFGGGLTAGAVITAAQFNTGAAAKDSSDRFVYNSATGALIFDPDGTGAATATQIALLSTGLAMTNNDIFVIP